ncbi:MAG: endonuclease Q family protein [Acidobacteriota bacterium]
MRFIADLHIHSRYSRATSRDMSPEGIWRSAQLKGISVIGTGDFTHPGWLGELREKTKQAGNGLFCLKKEFQADVPASCRAGVHFLLSAEISCIYRKQGKTRKIHCLLFVPDFSDAERINSALSKIGNLSADGRPILGLDAKDLLAIALDVSPSGMLVPAHAWTPHFSVFGAASGFDALEECFEDLTQHIYAIETGLSSDPLMNGRLSRLDGIRLISNSDAHSPAKIGREANIFETEISFHSMMNSVKTGGGFAGTIEFFPEEGKYHYDGHRACDVCLPPAETITRNGLCPVCGKRLTIGVMHRVEKLADRKEGFRPEGAPPFLSVIPLHEIIAETLQVGVSTKAVQNEYANVIERLGDELKILLYAPVEDIVTAGFPRLGQAIEKMRSGDISISPGYDGEYGKVKIFGEKKKIERKGQGML